MATPLERLRFHVSGAIARGEAQAIVGITADELEAFNIAKRDTLAEYAAIKRHGYSARDMAGMAASDRLEYEREIASAMARGDYYHAAFLRGCVAAIGDFLASIGGAA